MGVYDYFRGKCPHCDGNVDERDGEKYGDIQCKFFTSGKHHTSARTCFRDFYPGGIVPFAPGKDLVIGPTVCCGKDIKVVFDGCKIVKYEKS